MVRLGRLAAVAILTFGAISVVPVVAHADCTNPTDPDFGDCPTFPPQPTPKATPKPSATPAGTPVKTAAPTSHPVVTHRPTGGGTHVSTPEPTPFEVEVPTTEPNATPEIVVPGAIDNPQDTLKVQDSASASSWIFGFIVGLIVGGLIGRASWGLRKRRRNQIFG